MSQIIQEKAGVKTGIVVSSEDSMSLVTTTQDITPKQIELSIRDTTEDFKAPVGDLSYSGDIFISANALSTSATAGTNLISYNSSSLGSKSNVARVFNKYYFAKWDWVFKFEVMGHPNAIGQLIAAVIPVQVGTLQERVSGAVNPWPTSSAGMLSYSIGHTIIDVRKSSTQTIRAPYRMPYEWLTKNGTNECAWTVVVYYVTPYYAPTSTANGVSINFYASLDNVKGKGNAPWSQGLWNSTVINNNIDHIQELMMPMNVTGDSLSATAELPFGLDAPSSLKQSDVLVNAGFRKLTTSDNVIDAVSTHLESSSVVDFTNVEMELMGIKKDEMSLSNFNCREYYVGQYQISSTTATGTQLFQIPVDPCMSMITAATDTWANSNMRGGFQWLSKFYKYWKGDIIMRFYIVSNQFITGKVKGIFHYDAVSTNYPTTLTTTGAYDPNSIYSMTLDLDSDKPYYEIRIPFASVFTVLQTRYSATMAYTTTATSHSNSEVVLGIFSMYMKEQLMSATTGPSTAYIIVTSMWAENMEFFTASPAPMVFTSQGENEISEVKVWANRRRGKNTIFSSSLVPARSLKELLIRPTLYSIFNMPSNTALATIPPTAAQAENPVLMIPIILGLNDLSPEWSFVTNSYSAFKGGVRVLIRFLQTGSMLYKVSYIPLRSFGTNPPGQCAAAITTPISIINSTWYSSVNVTALPAGGKGNLDPSESAANTANSFWALANDKYQWIANPLVNVNMFKNVIETSVSHHIQVSLQQELVFDLEEPQKNALCNSTFGLGTNSIGPYNYMHHGFLAFTQLTTNVTDTSKSPVEVSLIAGDDLRFLYYNGGPAKVTSGANTLNTSGAFTRTTFLGESLTF